MSLKKKKEKQILWLKTRMGKNGKLELWISPEGYKEMFFLTDGKITLEEVYNFIPNGGLFKNL